MNTVRDGGVGLRSRCLGIKIPAGLEFGQKSILQTCIFSSHICGLDCLQRPLSPQLELIIVF